MNNSSKQFVIGSAAVVIIVAIILLASLLKAEATPTVTPGEVPIDLDADPDLLYQLEQQSQSGTTAPDSQFGGSSVDQSPSLETEQWQELLQGDFSR